MREMQWEYLALRDGRPRQYQDRHDGHRNVARGDGQSRGDIEPHCSRFSTTQVISRVSNRDRDELRRKNDETDADGVSVPNAGFLYCE